MGVSNPEGHGDPGVFGRERDEPPDVVLYVIEHLDTER